MSTIYAEYLLKNPLEARQPDKPESESQVPPIEVDKLTTADKGCQVDMLLFSPRGTTTDGEDDYEDEEEWRGCVSDEEWEGCVSETED